MEFVNSDQKDKLLTFLIMYHTCQNSKHKYLFPIIQKFLTSIFFMSIHLTQFRLPLPNDIDTRVNWLALTSYNRMKGHIMWINVSLDNDYLLNAEKIWKNCNEKVIIWVMHKGLWKYHKPIVTTNQEIPYIHFNNKGINKRL